MGAWWDEAEARRNRFFLPTPTEAEPLREPSRSPSLSRCACHTLCFQLVALRGVRSLPSPGGEPSPASGQMRPWVGEAVPVPMCLCTSFGALESGPKKGEAHRLCLFSPLRSGPWVPITQDYCYLDHMVWLSMPSSSPKSQQVARKCDLPITLQVLSPLRPRVGPGRGAEDFSSPAMQTLRLLVWDT